MLSGTAVRAVPRAGTTTDRRYLSPGSDLDPPRYGPLKLTTTIRRLAGVAAVAVLALGSVTACSAERTELNELKLVYKSGVGDDRKFDRCIAPGEAGDWIADNDVFTLPTDKRTWNIADSDDADQRSPIVSGSLPKVDPETHVSRPGPAVDVWLTTDFYLNWDCGFDYSKSLRGQKGSETSPVVTFFNRTGRTAEISSNSGEFDLGKWRSMLRTTLAKVELDVVQSETRKYDADQLDANLGDVYPQMEAAMGPAFQKALNAKMGGDYFCGVEYNGGRDVTWTERSLGADGNPVEKTAHGKCPPVRIDITNIDLHDPAIQDARVQAYVVEQQARAALAKARSDKEVANLAKDPNVMRLKELENERAIAEACARSGGGCTLIQGINPGAVNIPAK